MNRLTWVDLLKGILIILVVFGHVITNGVSANIIDSPALIGINGFIYIFHMPLFFFLSGFLTKDIFRNQEKGCFRRVFLKVIGLLIPYVLFSLVYGLLKLFFQNTSAVMNDIKPIDLALIVIRPIGEYWFLYSLLLIILVFYIISFSFKRVNKTIMLLVFLFVSVGFYVLSFFLTECYFTGFKRTLPYFLYFAFGFAFSNASFDFSKTIKLISGSLLLIISIALYSVLYIVLSYDHWPISFVLSLLMIIGLVFLSQFWSCWFIETSGKYSLPIYLIHPFLIVLFKVILLRFVANQYIYVLLSFALTFSICFIVYYLFIRRVPLLDFIFYPGRYLLGKKND